MMMIMIMRMTGMMMRKMIVKLRMVIKRIIIIILVIIIVKIKIMAAIMITKIMNFLKPYHTTTELSRHHRNHPILPWHHQTRHTPTTDTTTTVHRSATTPQANNHNYCHTTVKQPQPYRYLFLIHLIPCS